MILRLLLFAFVLSSFHTFAQWSDPLLNHRDTISIDTNDHPIAMACQKHLLVGDTMPDVYFYDTLGNRIWSKTLFKGKPVILITGSYSCPRFRYSVETMEKEMRKKAKTHDVYFVYIHEAHPVKGSPYGKKMDNNGWNRVEMINVKQHKYLGDRVAIARRTRHDFHVKTNILIDNERNGFFLNVCALPNGYMVFSPEGVLLKQRDWYDLKSSKRKQRKIKRKVKKMRKERQKKMEERQRNANHNPAQNVNR